MRFNINLATEPYQDVRQFLVRRGVAAGVLLIIAIALVFSAIHASREWRTTDKQARELQKRIDAQEQQKAAVAQFLDRPENRETHERSEFVNQLIARKAFSWTEVFTDLEHIVPGPLAIQSIQPEINDYDQLEVHLLAAGAAHESAVELVRRLELSPHFTHAKIFSEYRQTQAGSNQNAAQPSGWRFDISAIYVPSFARPGNPKTGPVPAEAKADEPAAKEPASSKLAKTTEMNHARH
jgi:type IV pilus assembly protein PilN